jgi:hypothetical protein
MVTKELAYKMQAAFPQYELDITPEQITEYPVKDGTAYVVNYGEIEFSRGLIDAYVYIVYNDGETTSQRVNTPSELELWTKHLA